MVAGRGRVSRGFRSGVGICGSNPSGQVAHRTDTYLPVTSRT
jgi:hypothetical protein